jgi:hypothetical protein
MQSEYQSTCIEVNQFICFTPTKQSCNFSAMKYGERIKTARLHAGFKTQGELISKLNGRLTQQGLSHLEAGDASGSELTVLIATICGVSPLWLPEEQGEMITYSKDDLMALEITRKLSVNERRQWYRLGRSFAEPDEGTNGKQ